jgi:Ca-activated chloride channel family protein
MKFNPAVVSRYGLPGDENRLLGDGEFSNDKADAEDIGAGQSAAELYEIIYNGVESQPRQHFNLKKDY